MTHCTTCKNGEMKHGAVTVTLDKDNSLVVFRNVPANVCDLCGDYTIEGEIAKKLLQIAKDEREKGHECSILNYTKAA